MIKTVLITGANRGIGFAFAEAYLKRGWKVYAACRDMGRVGELLELGGDVEVVPLDVTSMEEIEALAGMLKGKPLDVLINNAAVHGPRDATGTFGNIDPEAWMEVFRVNTIGPVKVTEALLPSVANGRRQEAGIYFQHGWEHFYAGFPTASPHGGALYLSH